MPRKKSTTRLEHSGARRQVGGAENYAPLTTRDDLLDAGVPMVAGQPDEPVGPEDALGLGPKRGDYTGRIASGPSLRVEQIAEADRDTDDNGEPGPTAQLVAADSDVGNIGDADGKGGVTTAEAQATAAPEAATTA